METKTDLMSKENGHCDDNPSDIIISVRNKDAKRRRKRRNLIRTIFDGLVVLFLGMQASQKGPSFLDLQLISDTDVKGASSYFTANSFGYMVGALMAGFVYDRMNNKIILICFPLTVASFLIGLTPWCTSYITMLVVHMASATQCAIPETTITADQFRIWQGKTEAPFQFLSFMYSLGGALGPLYTEPFLVPIWNETDHTVLQSEDQGRNPKTANVTNYISNPLNSSLPSTSTNETVNIMELGRNQTNPLLNFEDPPESDLHYAYMISGLFGILFSIPFYVMCFKNCTKPKQREIEKKESIENAPERLTLKPYIVLTVLSSFLFFFYTMTEDSFNMFLSMFLVSHLSWTKENGALVSSLYWGISTISKLISVPIVRRIDLGLILLVSCFGMVISMLAFLLASHYHIDVLIWISSSCFAMSQSTIFGGCFSWVDIHILKLDGKATSITMIAAAAGAMVGPLVLGITMEKFSLMVFPYIELTHAVMSTFIFVLMFFLLEPYVTKKYGPVRPKARDMIFSVDGNCTEVEIEEKKGMVPVDDDKLCDNVRVKKEDRISLT